MAGKCWRYYLRDSLDLGCANIITTKDDPQQHLLILSTGPSAQGVAAAEAELVWRPAAWQRQQRWRWRRNDPHKSQKWIYKIYNVAQFNKLLLVQLKCYVKCFS
jgi:hypothetical protein